MLYCPKELTGLSALVWLWFLQKTWCRWYLTQESRKPTTTQHSFNKPTTTQHSFNKPTTTQHLFNKPTTTQHSFNKPTTTQHSFNKPTTRINSMFVVCAVSYACPYPNPTVTICILAHGTYVSPHWSIARQYVEFVLRTEDAAHHRNNSIIG